MAKKHGLRKEASALSGRVTGSIKDKAGELVEVDGWAAELVDR